jgi:pimeloyl-ACP methyl ester carboxylesterase
MPQLDRAGTHIFYEVTGDATGQIPLLLSHGFGASSAMWQPNRAALAASGPVITWDLRGHGRSDSPADAAGYTHAACVADMAALLDAAGTERAVAGGLSLGGFLSLAFCLEMPHRVAGLVLCDTGPGFRSDEARERWNSRALATAGRLEREGLQALGDDSGPTAAGHRSAAGVALAARGMLTQSSSEVIDGLASIRVPALVLVGGRDEAFLGAAEYVAAKIPGARKAVIPDAGHMCNVDQPDLFNEAVLPFLSSLRQR